MLQIACKSEILAPKCNKKHANQRFWLQNSASSKENCPKMKKQKTFKQKKVKKKHHPSLSNFVPLLLQHTFKASDLVPDIFQSNTASRLCFHATNLTFFAANKLRSLSCLIQESRWFTLPTFTLIAFVPFPLASNYHDHVLVRPSSSGLETAEAPWWRCQSQQSSRCAGLGRPCCGSSKVI